LASNYNLLGLFVDPLNKLRLVTCFAFFKVNQDHQLVLNSWCKPCCSRWMR